MCIRDRSKGHMSSRARREKRTGRRADTCVCPMWSRKNRMEHACV